MLIIRLRDRTIFLNDVFRVKFCDSYFFFCFFPDPEPDDWLSIPFRNIVSFYFVPDDSSDAVF